ncbi:MAG: uroporphyrinogen-III C-methyltransferase [Halothece sp.]
MTNKNPVYLVGAGIGKIAHLTLEAKAILAEANVLVYDALVDSELLQLIPSYCLSIYVGKRGGKPSKSQTEINEILVKHCQEGKRVVRLKSGDPFIFGRSREEIEALQKAGCSFVAIPGISSAIAAPLFAEILVTDKDLSRCFVTLTGHDPNSLDWEALSRIDTLIILMGGRNLPIIVEKLQQNGRSPSSPIAIIKHAGRPNQQIWTGILADIVEKTRNISLSPTVIVIGEVVKLRDNWKENFWREGQLEMANSNAFPLSGKTILVTRSSEQSSKFNNLLQQQGATVIEMPALEITPPSSWEQLDYAIANLSDFHWLILTSANAVNYFFERLAVFGKDARYLAGLRIAVVGKKTASVLRNYNIKPDFIPPNFVADSLIEHFPDSLSDKQILFPRVETGGRDVLVKEFRERESYVMEVAAYESGCPENANQEAIAALQNQQVNIVTFASSKTVKNFHQLLQKSNLEQTPKALLKDVWIASIGPQTSATCYELFDRVDVEAEEYTLEGLTEAIVNQVRGDR